VVVEQIGQFLHESFSHIAAVQDKQSPAQTPHNASQPASPQFAGPGIGVQLLQFIFEAHWEQVWEHVEEPQFVGESIGLHPVHIALFAQPAHSRTQVDIPQFVGAPKGLHPEQFGEEQ